MFLFVDCFRYATVADPASLDAAAIAALPPLMIRSRWIKLLRALAALRGHPATQAWYTINSQQHLAIFFLFLNFVVYLFIYH